MPETGFRVGEVRLDRVVESEFAALDPYELYPDFTARHLADNLDWLAPRFYDVEEKRLIIAIQGFVVRSGGKTIVVDTCVGDCKQRTRPSFDRRQWNWPDRLRQAGITVDEVDYVICTHFHVDHVGWNTRLAHGKWVPTFPRARYLFVKAEWDFWWSEGGSFGRGRTGDYMQDSVLPVAEAGLVDFVAMDHRVDASVSLLPAPGHTPGLVCVSIASGGQQVVLASDVLHTPLQLVYPEWSTRFCADPVKSRATRLAFLERYADTDTLILPSHFPSPSAVRLARYDGRYSFRYSGVV